MPYNGYQGVTPSSFGGGKAAVVTPEEYRREAEREARKAPPKAVQPAPVKRPQQLYTVHQLTGWQLLFLCGVLMTIVSVATITILNARDEFEIRRRAAAAERENVEAELRRARDLDLEVRRLSYELRARDDLQIESYLQQRRQFEVLESLVRINLELSERRLAELKRVHAKLKQKRKLR